MSTKAASEVKRGDRIIVGKYTPKVKNVYRSFDSPDKITVAVLATEIGASPNFFTGDLYVRLTADPDRKITVV